MKGALGIAFLLFVCTGCWDTRDLNELAIMTIGAGDIDPETGDKLAYYQAINPPGLSNKGNNPMDAAVYTYPIRISSWAAGPPGAAKEMPRMFFLGHMQCYIISQRYAEKGFLDLLNYLEQMPEKRSNVYFFITDSPVVDVLHTFTKLERMPGRFIRALTELYGKNSGSSIVFSRVKDVVENVPQTQPLLVHMIHNKDSKPAASAKKLDDIDANKQSIVLTDRAVIRHAHMVGRMSDELARVTEILNGQSTRLISEIKIKDYSVEIEAYAIKVKRTQTSNKQLLFSIESNLRIVSNHQPAAETEENLKRIEKQFDLWFENEALQLIQFAKHRNWDVLGIRDQGYAVSANWSDTPIAFRIKSNVTSIGKTIAPYFVHE